ncbi:PQQ-dependent dehydrogenase, methanol/ethanol family, partial [Methylobacterium sp. J-059]|nr:PQQ-dependent dehydrogenase, methanol/ethanol family [Methylobacterium sp. J-059]
MRAVHLLALGASLAVAAPAIANDDLMKHLANPAEQFLHTLHYSNTPHRKPDQTNAGNVKNPSLPHTPTTNSFLFHYFSPLFFFNMMYVHTPFPNIFYSLYLDHCAKIVCRYYPNQ